MVFPLAISLYRSIFCLLCYAGGKCCHEMERKTVNLEDCSGFMVLTVESVLALISSSLEMKGLLSGCINIA